MIDVRRIGRLFFHRVETQFDAVFGPVWNPLYHLGALGWFFFWIVTVSGIYVYIFFDTGITQAYEALEYMTNEQWYAAGVMRSLHRYASDAMVVVMMLHLARELVMDRYRGARWFAWFTGIPLIWLVYICGITGYWVVWDQLAQYVAVVTTEWLDTLGIFAEPIARNFLNERTLSGRFFTLMVFAHIVIPLFLLFGMWIHIQRHSRPRVNPPKALAIGSMLAMLVLSLVYPARSQGPANLDTVPVDVGIDWFYLPVYPLLDVIPGGWLWVIIGGGSLLLFVTPWLPPLRRKPVAQVDLENCNGCGRCYNDCPFGAVTMQPRSDGSPLDSEAVVNPSQCTSCGTCVGACPTSTPFRRASDLRPGIDLPHLPASRIRELTLEAAGRLTGSDRVIVYGCQFSPDLAGLATSSAGVVSLRCVSMLPPSFLDFVISRGHADGVMLVGCPEGDCFYRLGIRWLGQRMGGERDPHLRKRVPRERIAMVWCHTTQYVRMASELAQFQARLRDMGPSAGSKSRPAEASAAGPAPEAQRAAGGA